MLTPAQFGLPPKFREWRPGQLDAVLQILDDKFRFEVVCAPTGFGKSLVYEAAASMSGKRMVVCTSTKGLMDQLTADFGQWDLRGQSNYQCSAAGEFGILGNTTVETGPCKSGAKCNLRTNGCEYFDRYSIARVAPVVHTNYALWMTDGQKQNAGDEMSREGNLTSKKPVDILVLDEAHNAPDHLADFLAEEVSQRDLSRAGIDWPDELMEDGKVESREAWRDWAGVQVAILDERIQSRTGPGRKQQLTPDEIRRVAAWKRAQRKLGKVAGMKGEWVIELTERWPELAQGSFEAVTSGIRARKEKVVRFDPLWPKEYAESVLFRSVKKIVLISATVRPKTADVLGVPATEVRFREYGSSFPTRSRPTIHVPTVQMNHRITDFGLMVWLGMIDRILDGRMDRKGVIHTVSYQRAQLILANSRHSSRMLSHDSKTRQSIVEQFKRSTGNTMLVSPSVDTGYDFPYSECEFQIISKVPFQDGRGKVMKARATVDKRYADYVAAQVVVQMTGRGMRAEDDKCETLIVDDNIRWFVKNNKDYFPKWWMEAYRSTDGAIPEPLSKL